MSFETCLKSVRSQNMSLDSKLSSEEGKMDPKKYVRTRQAGFDPGLIQWTENLQFFARKHCISEFVAGVLSWRSAARD